MTFLLVVVVCLDPKRSHSLLGRHQLTFSFNCDLFSYLVVCLDPKGVTHLWDAAGFDFSFDFHNLFS